MAEKKSENAKAAAKKTAKKPNVFKRLAKYLGSCKSEIKKITWPTAKQTTKNFGIVIAFQVCQDCSSCSSLCCNYAVCTLCRPM